MIFEGVLLAGMAISSVPQQVVGLVGAGSRSVGLTVPSVMALFVDAGSATSPAPSADALKDQPKPQDQPKEDSEAQGHPLPRITVIDPPRAPVWDMKDRIAWGANIVLALLGYAGIMVAISALRKIERQTKYFEEAVTQAKTAADAALLHAEALVRAERPWVMITVEPSPSVANSSVVVATNRGKSPARLIAATDRIVGVPDEQHVPARPDYGEGQVSPLPQEIILLPGECAEIRIFGTEDVKRFCDSEEKLKRVEEWQERLFVYGKVIYKDLIAPADERQLHETSWCCWYVAGKSASGLVAVSVPAFRVLT